MEIPFPKIKNFDNIHIGVFRQLATGEWWYRVKGEDASPAGPFATYGKAREHAWAFIKEIRKEHPSEWREIMVQASSE